MDKLIGKKVLIGSAQKKESLLLFNFFDGYDAEMIYSAKDLAVCHDMLGNDSIDFLLVECSEKFIKSSEELSQIKQKYPSVKIGLMISESHKIDLLQYQQMLTFCDTALFAPLSPLEVSIKLKEFISSNNSSQVFHEDSDVVESKKSLQNNHKSEELWNAFFTDSIQAKLIVNAASQEITYVNESLLDLIQKKESQIVGQSWNHLDVKDNHKNYQEYIKEINSNEKTSFVVKNRLHNRVQNLQAEYQMGVIDEDIVFIGVLSLENILGVSSEAYKQFEKVNAADVTTNDFIHILEDLRKYLQFSFLIFFEFKNKKLFRPKVVGDKVAVKNLLNNSKDSLLSSISNNKIIEVDLNNNRMSSFLDVLQANQLQSLCVYPIHHQQDTYGSVIAGGKNPMENWDTVSLLLRSLTNQCRFSLFQKNMANQKKLQEQRDALTGLPNRISMTEKLAQIGRKGVEDGKYISLMIIDIEKLNLMNKNLNMELRDEVMLSLSRLVVQNIRVYGQVYRSSEDEFVVLMHPHIEKSLSEQKAKELVKKLDHSVLLSNGENAKINFNIGVSIFPDDGQTISSMMKNADLAMYDAKLASKNNYVIFKYAETGKALKQKTEMEENLKIAIEQNHIKIYLQPKINAKTEDVVGFEALVRWIDPEIGMINPGHFIPLAEETGLINEIGEYITKKACELLIKWQKDYELNLTCSINLSAVQLIDPQLPKKMERIINQSGVHPHLIDFEITETISLDVVPNLVESLNEIVSIGCTLSIDDFGTGHSSLDYIKKIPAKFIKVDQSFVKNIGLNPEDEAILDATINMAKRLNRKIIAEGVETEEQREYLQERACDYFQGFLFARPLPEHEIDQLLKQRVELMGSS